MRTRALINIKQLKQNYLALSQMREPAHTIMPVIKAHAYGHDALIVAKALDKLNPVAFGVADLNEALEIGHLKLKTPCFNFGYIDPLLLHESIQQKVILSLFCLEDIAYLGTISAQLKAQLRLHIKVDTGMNRIGFKKNQWSAVIELIDQHDLKHAIQGIFTHLSDSNQLNFEHSQRQLDQFSQAKIFFEQALNKKLTTHCASSSPVQHLSSLISSFDWIRPGIALYGYPYQQNPNIKPILTWKAKIIQIKDVAVGESIGYNQSYIAAKPMRIGIISVGYGDGFFKEYHNHTLYYKNEPCPIVGDICMDMCMIDLSNIKEALLGDEVFLISEKKCNDTLHLSQQTNKSVYEILTSIGKRVVREATSDKKS
ncbi:MAG TPA: alanine racemase [Oligoflexia bacterium]|mgnify:CR=1 FL=1|nr:alanine racemase [Oligoflexia bacterium]HMR24792.1 alanine racemase [Oligoflexia bacterium]